MRHLLAATAAALLTVGLCGCSAPAPATPPSAGSPKSDDVAAPAATTAAARAALATATVPLASEYGDGTLTYSVIGLSVNGGLTELDLELRADGDLDAGDLVIQLVGRPGAARGLAPELIDPVHLKAYSEAEAGLGIVDGAGVTLADGVPSVFTFRYAAPQDPVTTFDVAIGSGLPTFRAVPLSR